MERLLRVASPLGLYAEEFDTGTARYLGNFPQAFSHLALIEAAGRIILAERVEESHEHFVRRHHHRHRRGGRHARSSLGSFRQADPAAGTWRLAHARTAELVDRGRVHRQPLHLSGHVDDTDAKAFQPQLHYFVGGATSSTAPRSTVCGPRTSAS